MHLDLTDLRLFVHVVETGSITHGVDRSRIALGATSTRIRNLEAMLKISLLRRMPRRIETIPAGEVLLGHAWEILNQPERLDGELGPYTDGIGGYVRILSNMNALTEFLPHALSTFLAAYPRVTVDLEARLSDEIVQAMVSGAADIGIVAGTVNFAGLQTIAFREDRLVLIVSADHPLVQQRTVRFVDLLDYNFVGLGQASAIQSFLANIAAGSGRRLKLRTRLRCFHAVCAMVERNVGFGIVPATAADICGRHMAIRSTALTDDWAARNLPIYVHQMAELPLQARLLSKHLVAEHFEPAISLPQGPAPLAQRFHATRKTCASRSRNGRCHRSERR